MTNTSHAAATKLLTLNEVLALVLTIAIAVALVHLSSSGRTDVGVAIPAPSAEVVAVLQQAGGAGETAVFAGGCFWGIQAVFQHTQGVLSAVSGYAGGEQADANYQLVRSGATRHAEAVQLSYDPRQVSYAQLLQIYFSVAHDPTQLNRQYPDVGSQYRSEVFYTDAIQKQMVERYIAQLNAAMVFPSKIVTQLSPLKAFYPAEDYHQNYATRHPDSAYIAQFDRPKIARLKALMPALYRETPLLVAAHDAGVKPASPTQ